ncbi:hypothetical protein K7432_015927 [Basidiobolus ranarum]|uniref:DOMON domain-containing protein n=1 Tax=Basidiobolus ranarum TaxID=34480 RepID=A0ABR2VMB4_9FUNG
MGGLAENKIPGSSFGELFFASMENQFVKIRNLDAYWYENSPDLIEYVKSTTWKDVLGRNLPKTASVPSSIWTLQQESSASLADLSGAYRNEYVATDMYKLNWNIQGNEINFALQLKSDRGWCGVGINQVGVPMGMMNADFVVANFSQGVVSVAPYDFQGLSASVPVSNKLYTITGQGITTSNGVTTIRFTRPLDAGTPNKIINTKLLLIWAYSTTETTPSHHRENKGKKEMNFFTGESSNAIGSTHKFHGIGMVLTWTGLYPRKLQFSTTL